MTVLDVGRGREDLVKASHRAHGLSERNLIQAAMHKKVIGGLTAESEEGLDKAGDGDVEGGDEVVGVYRCAPEMGRWMVGIRVRRGRGCSRLLKRKRRAAGFKMG